MAATAMRWASQLRGDRGLGAMAGMVVLALVGLQPGARPDEGGSVADWTPLHPRFGYDGADTQPDHHAATSLQEHHSVTLLAAAGAVAWEGHRAQAPAPERVAALLPTLDRELARYPAGLLRHAGLQSVALARAISAGDERVGGVTFGGGRVLLDVEAKEPRWVIHHEMWHQLERGGQLDSGGITSGCAS
jgi:hypothetical protein